MSYDPSQLLSIWGLTEAQAVAQKRLRLGYLDLGADGLIGIGDDTWTRAVEGNFGGTPNFVGNHAYNSSYFVLGDYGVDTTNHVVWAVIDYSGQFAAVPEPPPSSFSASVPSACWPTLGDGEWQRGRETKPIDQRSKWAIRVGGPSCWAVNRRQHRLLVRAGRGAVSSDARWDAQ